MADGIIDKSIIEKAKNAVADFLASVEATAQEKAEKQRKAEEKELRRANRNSLPTSDVAKGYLAERMFDLALRTNESTNIPLEIYRRRPENNKEDFDLLRKYSDKPDDVEAHVKEGIAIGQEIRNLSASIEKKEKELAKTVPGRLESASGQLTSQTTTIEEMQKNLEKYRRGLEVVQESIAHSTRTKDERAQAETLAEEQITALKKRIEEIGKINENIRLPKEKEELEAKEKQLAKLKDKMWVYKKGPYEDRYATDLKQFEENFKGTISERQEALKNEKKQNELKAKELKQFEQGFQNRVSDYRESLKEATQKQNELKTTAAGLGKEMEPIAKLEKALELQQSRMLKERKEVLGQFVALDAKNPANAEALKLLNAKKVAIDKNIHDTIENNVGQAKNVALKEAGHDLSDSEKKQIEQRYSDYKHVLTLKADINIASQDISALGSKVLAIGDLRIQRRK